MEIPQLDLEQIGLHIIGGPTKEALVALGQSLRKAFSSVGFAYIKNHGIEESLINEAMKASETFFKLSNEAKMAIPREPDVQQGYVAPGREIFDQKEDGTKAAYEYREAFEVSRIGVNAQFPDREVPELRPALTNLALATKKLSLRLLQSLALGLNLDVAFFVDCHERTLLSPQSISKLRSIYYPPILEVDKQGKGQLVRCGEHSDYGTLTFLYQDQMGGLEVRAIDNSWIEATPIPGTIVINVGDLLEIWTCGLFRATLHRVVIPEEEKKLKKARQSIVLFVHPDSSTTVRPLIENEGRKYEPITALEHVKKRFAATYQY